MCGENIQLLRFWYINNNISYLNDCSSRVGWARIEQSLNSNLLLRSLGQNIVESTQEKSLLKLSMFDSPNILLYYKY